MKIHACWLDRRCRATGAPAYTYLHFKHRHLCIAPEWRWRPLRFIWIPRHSDGERDNG